MRRNPSVTIKDLQEETGLSKTTGTGTEVNPESWTQLKGSNEKRI